MEPDDRVLVGVVKRKRDLRHARDDHWYRVPLARAPRGLDAEVVALFLSRAFGERNGGIHFYAEWRGVELVRRIDLLPGEPGHPRARELYYRIALGELQELDPPILNLDRRLVSFIATTWDRFICARSVSGLYAPAGPLGVRVYRPAAEGG